MDLSKALTESVNPASRELDKMPTVDIVRLMNAEDEVMLLAVSRAAARVALLVDATAERLARGGRLFYVGAGTSGRLGVLDASECPPTFGTNPELVQGIIAGGPKALVSAVEHAEDDPAAAAAELDSRGFGSNDVVVGISASGRTPFALGAVRHGRSLGALTASIYCNPGAPLENEVEHPICVAVGPEVLTGSTRLKAGTATKLVLNQLSTAVMVRLGKVLGNLMVDLTPTCEKLRDRSIRILATAAGLDLDKARQLLDDADGDLRLAVEKANHL